MPRHKKENAVATLESLRKANLDNAAILLAKKLFGPDPVAKAMDLGYVACGEGKIYVYIRGRAEAWEQKEVHHFAGYPVIWHYDVGPALALAEPK